MIVEVKNFHVEKQPRDKDGCYHTYDRFTYFGGSRVGKIIINL